MEYSLKAESTRVCLKHQDLFPLSMKITVMHAFIHCLNAEISVFITLKQTHHFKDVCDENILRSCVSQYRKLQKSFRGVFLKIKQWESRSGCAFKTNENLFSQWLLSFSYVHIKYFNLGNYLLYSWLTYFFLSWGRCFLWSTKSFHNCGELTSSFFKFMPDVKSEGVGKEMARWKHMQLWKSEKPLCLLPQSWCGGRHLV